MSIDNIRECSLWPQEISLTPEEEEAIAKLKSRDHYNFRGTDYVFVGKSEKEAEWTLLA